MKISTERELVFEKEEAKRKSIMEKVFKLEQRLLSLQTAQAMKCHSCRQYVRKMTNLEAKLKKILADKKMNQRELSNMKIDALEATISEKDAHLAFLEITGIRNAKQAEEAERLKSEKILLVQRLQQENERSASLFEDQEEDSESPSDVSEKSNDDSKS